MQSISEQIVDSLIASKIISDEEKELYVYGAHQGFILLVNIVTTILIGLLFDMLAESLIFLISYIPLRSNAGGYHAKTSLRCYIFSTIMIIVVLLAIRIHWSGFSVTVIAIFSIGIIILLAPVEDANKSLDQKEKVVFKKRTNIILSILVGLAILLWFVKQQVSICILASIAILSIMVILGKLKNMI